MEKKDELKPKVLEKEAVKFFIELEGRKPTQNPSDGMSLGIIESAIKRGYELGYEKFHVEMCENCKENVATCFGPGSLCHDCALEEAENEEN